MSIGRDGEVSIERLWAEAIGVGSGTGRGGHDQEEVVVGLGGARSLCADMGGGTGAREETREST